MRYFIAIILAIICAGAAMQLAGSHVADAVAGSMTFESSDDAENVHMWAYLGTSLLGLIVGWTIGWAIGGRFDNNGPTPNPGK
jgi:phosphate/sulfate permease